MYRRLSGLQLTNGTWRDLPHLQRHHQTFFVTFSSYQRHLLADVTRDITLECCRFGEGTLFHLHAAVVMPDHVHLLLTPIEDEQRYIPSLGKEVLRAIKGVSSRRSNQILGRRGPTWQAESFDHALRSHEKIHKFTEYIINNPVRKGLVSEWREYRWIWVSPEFERQVE